MAKQKIFNRQNLRSPTVFFGIGEEQAFYVEKVPSLLTERIKHNLSFFYLNYVMVTTLLFCLTLLISPSAIIGIGLLGFAWLAVIRATSEGQMQVKGEFFQRTQRLQPDLKLIRQLIGIPSGNTRGRPVTKGITITQKQATIAMGGVSILALIWLLSHIFWMTLGTSGFLCGVHALFRDASMHKDEEDRVTMQGDLSLDDEAAFLNSSGPSLA